MQGQTVTLSSPKNIVIQSQYNISATAGAAMSLQSGAAMTVRGNATTTVEGVGGLNLKGPTVRLNNGNKPVATVGSAVSGGKVLTGSMTILGE